MLQRSLLVIPQLQQMSQSLPLDLLFPTVQLWGNQSVYEMPQRVLHDVPTIAQQPATQENRTSMTHLFPKVDIVNVSVPKPGSHLGVTHQEHSKKMSELVSLALLLRLLVFPRKGLASMFDPRNNEVRFVEKDL
mmetsp:Transcript_38118/g.98439  ORF Transcript_38118/g.98439 Transcript_38118/m.98439 type:complete len:134 (+) Transcript_38118:303-704(+)